MNPDGPSMVLAEVTRINLATVLWMQITWCEHLWAGSPYHSNTFAKPPSWCQIFKSLTPMDFPQERPFKRTAAQGL
ncbi:putative protein_ isoform A [Caligus rogercresseyi]|uniref:Uncharacterized protein n=1 Tax=Caligus rogercresseyi TaxID=217165 RepID=A0A7T8QVH8_CALRO|nr:putative protein_ isoform A [Caligus rogercresseyi]